VPSEICSIEELSIEYYGWALGTLPDDGNVMPKHVGATIHNILNEQFLHLLVFHAHINEIHSSRSKLPSKKFSSDSVARRDLIPALEG
jgi:hypothetical protein